MEDLINGISEMPFWYQVGMGWFVLTAIVMLVSPSVEYRRHRSRFAGLARDMGATPTQGRDKWPVSFTVTVDGRGFDVSYDHRGRMGGGHRGPSGHVLITLTALSGSRWKLHEVDIVPGVVPRWLRPKSRPAGTAALDAPFQVTSSGVPVREGWFDADSRAAVTAFYALDPELGPMAVREQRLIHLTGTPWPARDGASLRALLHGQAAVATAFERSAGWRGPVA